MQARAQVDPHAALRWYAGMQHINPALSTLLLCSPFSPAGSQRVQLGQCSQYSNSGNKAGDVPAELSQGECIHGVQGGQFTKHVVPMQLQCPDAL